MRNIAIIRLLFVFVRKLKSFQSTVYLGVKKLIHQLLTSMIDDWRIKVREILISVIYIYGNISCFNADHELNILTYCSNHIP